jgi:hypothetical protein
LVRASPPDEARVRPSAKAAKKLAANPKEEKFPIRGPTTPRIGRDQVADSANATALLHHLLLVCSVQFFPTTDIAIVPLHGKMVG